VELKYIQKKLELEKYHFIINQLTTMRGLVDGDKTRAFHFFIVHD